MNHELQAWLNDNAITLFGRGSCGESGESVQAVPLWAICELFDGKVLVPVEMLKEMQVYLSSNRLSNQIRAIIDKEEST
jgi:hypothetical protein